MKFKERLKSQFNLELMGKAHWYMATRINQLASFGIELVQSRYFLAVIKKYLYSAGAKKAISHHTTSFPLDFISSTDDCSSDESTSKE
jgi:hypothetical protein